MLGIPLVHLECRLIADRIADFFSIGFWPYWNSWWSNALPSWPVSPVKACWTQELSQRVRTVFLPGRRRHLTHQVGVELVKQGSPPPLSFALSPLPSPSPSTPCGCRCCPPVGVGRRRKVWSPGNWDRSSATWLTISAFHFVLAGAGPMSWRGWQG